MNYVLIHNLWTLGEKKRKQQDFFISSTYVGVSSWSFEWKTDIVENASVPVLVRPLITLSPRVPFRKPNVINFYSKFRWWKVCTHKGMALFLSFQNWECCHWTYLPWLWVPGSLELNALLHHSCKLLWHPYLVPISSALVILVLFIFSLFLIWILDYILLQSLQPLMTPVVKQAAVNDWSE